MGMAGPGPVRSVAVLGTGIMGAPMARNLEPSLFLETIAGGPLDAGHAQLKGKLMLEGSFPAVYRSAGDR